MTRFPLRVLTEDEQRTSKLANQKEEAEEQAHQLAEQIETKRDDSLRVVRAKQAAFEETAYGRLAKSIREDYLKWTQRGEFETAAQATQRVDAQGAAEFEKIRQAQTASSRSRYLRHWQQTYAALDHYNIDRSTYTLTLEPYETNYNRVDTVSVLLPVQAAKALKEGGYVGKPVYVPIETAFVNNSWQVSKALVLFNFSPEANGCFKQLGLAEGEPVHVQSDAANGWLLVCESCNCANPIGMKNLASEYAAILPRPSQETAELSTQPQKTGMSKTVKGGGNIKAGALASALLSTAIGSNTPITIPGKKTTPTTPLPKASATIYWVEWTGSAATGGNEAITLQSLGLVK